jgi:hypothetical protein
LTDYPQTPAKVQGREHGRIPGKSPVNLVQVVIEGKIVTQKLRIALHDD